MMSDTAWQVTFAYVADAPETVTYSVVEREDGRTIRDISAGLTKEEAHAIANCREVIHALQDLSDALEREDHEEYFDIEVVGDEHKAALDVLMRAKGVKT